MKKNRLLRIISTILSIVCLIIVGITFTDYIMVKNGNEPIFCLSREVVNNEDGNTNICKGLLYTYYDTVGDGYVKKNFVPIWNNNGENNNE